MRAPETRSGRLRCALRSAVRLLSRAWSPQRMHAPQQKRCGDQICCEDRVNYLCRLHPCIVLAASSTPCMKCQQRRQNTAAQRLSSWRKGTRRRERRATSPESARARARAAAASAQPAQSEARAKSPQGQPRRRVAPSTRRALYETTSVTEAFCSRSAPIKRSSAFCCILPLGVSRVACFHERQPALFFFGCADRRPIVLRKDPRKAVKRSVSWSCRCLQRIAHCIASRQGQALELLLQLQ